MGSTVALDLLEISLKEFPEVWSSGEKGSLAVWLEETAAPMIPTRDPPSPYCVRKGWDLDGATLSTRGLVGNSKSPAPRGTRLDQHV